MAEDKYIDGPGVNGHLYPVLNPRNKFRLMDTTLPYVDDQLAEVTADAAAVVGMAGRLVDVLVKRGVLSDAERRLVWALGDDGNAPQHETQNDWEARMDRLVAERERET